MAIEVGMQKHMDRVRAFLRSGRARLESAGEQGMMILTNRQGAMRVDAAALAALAQSGAIVRQGGQVKLAPMPSAPVNRDRGEGVVEIAGIRSTVEVNFSESPLGQLMRRKDKDGRPFLSAREFQAGERLRSDYTRGCIMPRFGANWEPGVSSGQVGDGNGIADLTDAALAARQRVDHALKAVGPELSGLLVDVCCFLKGLETVERERSWPVRSAKVVLKTALGVLARHYHPDAAPRQPRAFHWGSDDYRPSLS